MKLRTLLLPAFALIGASAHAADFFADFSSTQGANGWTYGTSVTPNGALTLSPTYSAPGTGLAGMEAWTAANSTSSVPAAFKNQTGNTNYGILSGQAALHGGEDGRIAFTAYTIPTAGVYTVSGSFFAGDTGLVDLYVYAAGASVTNLKNQAGNVPFLFTDTYAANSVIYFGVGIGNDGFGSDSTPLSATITPQAVPEPASMAALGLGALGLLRRRRKA